MVSRSRISTAFLAIIGTSLYLLLAIWGWGDWTSFFANPARLGLVLVTLVAAVVACFTKSSGLSGGKRELTSNRWVFGPILVLSVATGWLPAHAERAGWWTFGGDAVRYVGLVVYAVGCAIRLIPVFELGHRFSGVVAIQPNHQLKTDGLYRFVRHPSYAGLLLTMLGWALVFRNGVGLLITAAMLIPLVGRMRGEEGFLAEEFGEEYAAYRRQTRWRLLPGIY